MEEEAPPRQSLAPLILFEIFFGAIGVGLAWLLGLWPDGRLESLGWPYHSASIPDIARDILVGLIWSIPLLIVVNLVRRLPWKSIKELEEWSDRFLLPLIRDRGLIAMALIAASAGLGEELFFRWAMQTSFVHHFPGPWGIGLGLAVTSLVFGLLHAMTPTYGLIAGLLGLALGIELLVTESLLAVIVTHAFYDFVVLVGALIEDARREARSTTEATKSEPPSRS